MKGPQCPGTLFGINCCPKPYRDEKIASTISELTVGHKEWDNIPIVSDTPESVKNYAREILRTFASLDKYGVVDSLGIPEREYLMAKHPTWHSHKLDARTRRVLLRQKPDELYSFATAMACPLAEVILLERTRTLEIIMVHPVYNYLIDHIPSNKHTIIVETIQWFDIRFTSNIADITGAKILVDLENHGFGLRLPDEGSGLTLVADASKDARRQSLLRKWAGMDRKVKDNTTTLTLIQVDEKMCFRLACDRKYGDVDTLYTFNVMAWIRLLVCTKSRQTALKTFREQLRRAKDSKPEDGKEGMDSDDLALAAVSRMLPQLFFGDANDDENSGAEDSGGEHTASRSLASSNNVKAESNQNPRKPSPNEKLPQLSPATQVMEGIHYRHQRWLDEIPEDVRGREKAGYAVLQAFALMIYRRLYYQNIVGVTADFTREEFKEIIYFCEFPKGEEEGCMESTAEFTASIAEFKGRYDVKGITKALYAFAEPERSGIDAWTFNAAMNSGLTDIIRFERRETFKLIRTHPLYNILSDKHLIFCGVILFFNLRYTLLLSHLTDASITTLDARGKYNVPHCLHLPDDGPEFTDVAVFVQKVEDREGIHGRTSHDQLVENGSLGCTLDELGDEEYVRLGYFAATDDESRLKVLTALTWIRLLNAVDPNQEALNALRKQLEEARRSDLGGGLGDGEEEHGMKWAVGTALMGRPFLN